MEQVTPHIPEEHPVEPPTPRADTGGEAVDVDQRAFVGPIILAALFTLVFWEFLWRQVRFAITEQADWGHTLVIPAIAAYFVYRRRDELKRTPFRTTWLGLLPLVLGMAVYMFATVGPQAFNHHNLKGAGFGISLFGTVLLFTGPAAVRWLYFPIAYLIVFGQTISNQVMHIVTYRMQDIAALGAEKMFLLLGMDATRTGNVVTLFYNGVEHPLNIAEACSGMRMLMAFLALGVAMGYTGLRYNWQRVLIVILAVPIAIFVNVLRVVTLGFLSIFNADFAAGDFHTFVGLVWLVPAFLLFLGAMWVVKMFVIEDDSKTMAPSLATASASPRAGGALLDSGARRAFIVASAALLITGVGFRIAVNQLSIYLTKLPVDLREKFPTIPRTLNNWQAAGADRQFDAALVETLGTDEYLDRTYVWRESRNPLGAATSNASPAGRDAPTLPVNVHLAYYTGMIDAVPHIPDRCFAATGMARVGTPKVLDARVDSSTWQIDPDGAVHHATGKPYRTMSFPHRITGRPVTVRLPLGVTEGPDGMSGSIQVRTTEFRVPERPDSRVFAGFFFIANGQMTPFPLEVRSLAFDWTDKYAYYCKVQFTMEGGRDFDHAAFEEHVGNLLNELLPEIMRCLPDWAEVEASSANVADTPDS